MYIYCLFFKVCLFLLTSTTPCETWRHCVDKTISVELDVTKGVIADSNGYRKRGYVDSEKVGLLIWSSFIGQFVHLVGRDGIG